MHISFELSISYICLLPSSHPTPNTPPPRPTPPFHTDKKENKIFHIYKEIKSGAVAKSYMRKGFLI
jgi:hypothetical protein